MNHVQLTACVVDIPSMRRSPSGLMIQELILEHNEQVIEAGKPRTVQMRFPVKVMGEKAKEAGQLTLGTSILCEGFLAPIRMGSFSLQLRMTSWRLL